MAASRARLFVLTSIAVILALDLATNVQIQVETLYFFPLAVAALQLPSTLEAMLFAVSIVVCRQFVSEIEGFVYASQLYWFIALANTAMTSLLTVALARQIRRYYSQTVNLAMTDALTGIANRRVLMDSIEREIGRLSRHRGMFSIVMIDVDDFKRINDTMGHKAGDALLKMVADDICSTIRRTDVACRLGGDEFALMLVESNREDSSRICAKLSDTIRAHSIQRGFETTVSIGCITFDTPPENAEEALSQTDKMLYIAKGNGKACVVSK
ncbi:MAG: GGDEF domain-containing protein [Burkholderiales bacterium]|nr:GGDEF domain-containing protein [Burkholderiales bacterium]